MQTKSPVVGKTGRNKRTMYDFHPGHPLYNSHVQVLRAKQPTLIFNAHPPKPPGKPPQCLDAGATPYEMQEFDTQLRQWSKDAAAFAQYHIICFFPHPEFFGDNISWDSATKQNYLSWDKFASGICSMEKSKQMIDRLRLDAMFTFVYGMRADKKRQQLLSNFRHRETTRWNNTEKYDAEKLYSSLGTRQGQFNNQESSEVLDQLETTIFSTQKIRDTNKNLHFCKEQSSVLNKLFPSKNKSRQNGDSLNACPVEHATETNHGTVLQYVNESSKTRTTANELAAAHLPRLEKREDKKNLKRNRDGTFISPTATAARYLQERNLSASQAAVVEKVFQYFSHVTDYRCQQQVNDITFQHLHDQGIKALRLMLTGDPGSGKSYVIETICELAAIMKLGFVGTTSYNGIAAVNVDGNTISSTFSIFDTSDEKSTQPINALELRNKLDASNMCFLIIDEVSTIDGKILAIVDLRLQQVYNNTLPFGGMPIMLAGDFNQLGPVQKTFIPDDMMT